MVVKIYIGNDRIDLYKDENISLKSSIADTQDITKNTTDFTKSFTVPASDTNNRIFKHYYDATIDNSFDARIKIDGRIELDGMPFKSGKWRLQKVKVKKGVADSYTINFWGNLVNLQSKLGNDYLKDLDLTAFDHDYNGTNTITGLTSSLFTGAIVYNLLVKKQLFYNSDPADNTQSSQLANIAFNAGVDTGVIWNTLRASLRLINIIEAIEQKYDLVFTRDFFGRTEFLFLYLWLNNDKNEVLTTSQIVDFDGGDTTNVNLTTNIGTFEAGDTPASNDRRRWTNRLTVTPVSGFENVPYTVKCYLDGDVVKENTYDDGGTQTQEYILNPETPFQDYEIYYEVETEQAFEYTASWYQKLRIGTFPEIVFEYTTTGSSNSVSSFFSIANNIPKIKVTDFLKGIFKAFKLVVIPLEDGTLYVNTLESYYSEGILHDYTPYVDLDSYDVARGDILNEIIYNFEEPTTILNTQFEKTNRIAYGDEEALLTDEEGEPLDGKKAEFKIPFEQVVYERLTDINDSVQTSVQYGAIIDEEINPVNPKPHIFYNINTDLAGKNIAFIDENDVRTDLGNFINTASHSDTFEDSKYSFIFSNEFSTWNGELLPNNLYSNYHQTYIDSLFNIKRRNWTYKAFLPLDKLTSLELNAVLKIKQDYYRIDSYDLNLLTGEANLKLINAFDEKVGGFNPSQRYIYVDSNSQIYSIYVTFLGNYSYNKVDIGDGTAWFSVSNSGSNVYFAFLENTTGAARQMLVDFTNDDTGQEFQVYVNQRGGTVRFDSNTVTFDSDEITFDNG